MKAAPLKLDRPPPGWHAISAVREGDGTTDDWVVFVVDVPYEDLKHCLCRTAWLFVHPKDYRWDGKSIAQEAYVRIPGKHRTEKAAWRAYQKFEERESASQVVPA